MIFFKKYTKRKEILSRELEIYKQEQLIKIERELEDYRINTNKQIHYLAIKCAEDRKNQEHDYHHGLELLGIDIARLEAKKDNLEITTHCAILRLCGVSYE